MGPPAPGNDGRAGPSLSRRGLLQLGAVGTIAAQGLVGAEAAVAPGPLAALSERTGPDAAAARPTFSTLVRRREDQLMLRVDCYGLALTTGGREPQLVAVRPRGDLVVVVTFMPQHIGEEAVYELSFTASDATVPGPPVDPPSRKNSDKPPGLPVGARIAGGSRLAFLVPRSVLPIPFTIDGLLDWAAWTPAVSPSARGSLQVEPIRRNTPRPELSEPTALQTAIELPWWLLLSPHRQTGWRHATEPVTHNGRTELWHTRLAGQVPGQEPDEQDAARKTVRAVWARDPVFPFFLDGFVDFPTDGEDFSDDELGMPFRTAVSPRDRFDLVVSSAYYAKKLGSFKVPDPIDVDDLMLSSQGAWIDAQGSWQPGNAPPGVGNSLASWRHVATGGRDQYVRVVRTGHLCGLPFGAALFKVTERSFRTVGSGRLGNPKRRVAYLLQRYFVVLRQREVVLDGTRQRDKGHRFPFTRLRAKTVITPTIRPPKKSPGLSLPETWAFVIRTANGAPFLFEMEGIDRAGRPVDLSVPALFVDGTISSQVGAEMQTLRTWYNGLSEDAPERVVELRGQLLAPAEPTEPGGTDTDVEVHRMTLGLEPPVVGTTDGQLVKEDRPGYFPTLAEAEVRLAAAEAVLDEGMADTLPVMELDPDWVKHGFGTAATKGEVFVRLKDWQNPTSSRLDFGGQGEATVAAA